MRYLWLNEQILLGHSDRPHIICNIRHLARSQQIARIEVIWDTCLIQKIGLLVLHHHLDVVSIATIAQTSNMFIIIL